MSVRVEGSNIVVDGSIAGSLFPKTESEIVFPVFIDGSKSNKPVHIEGSVYGRAINMRGSVTVDGPIVSRGDTKLEPLGGKIQLNGGITVNGILNGISAVKNEAESLLHSVDKVSVVIRGDVAVNQSLFLSNAIVFGSVKAVNCKIQNCIVLGTLNVKEKLTVSMSSIGGYSANEVCFEGSCLLLHALGESNMRPVFAPFETLGGEIIPSDVRFYPATREFSRIVNLKHQGVSYPTYSALDPYTDWVQVNVHSKSVDSIDQEEEAKFVLSIGGRIGDFTKIQGSIDALTAMLKCGFEYSHLSPLIQSSIKESVLANLNEDEKWILEKVCH